MVKLFSLGSNVAMSNNDYIPISCAQHSEYELAIMQKKELHIRWRENHSLHHANVLPVDLQTRNQAEYLLVINESEQTFEIRLDTIL